MRRAAVVVLAACANSVAPPILSNHAPEPKSLFTITEERFGPVDARSDATLDGVKLLFGGYRIELNNEGSTELDVYDRAEKLLFVVPTSDGKVFNVHATSPRIASERGWRVGSAFHGTWRLTTCECWGANPTCWHAGEHVAVNFPVGCDDIGNHHVPHALEGERVQRVVWSPNPFPHLETGAAPD